MSALAGREAHLREPGRTGLPVASGQLLRVGPLIASSKTFVGSKPGISPGIPPCQTEPEAMFQENIYGGLIGHAFLSRFAGTAPPDDPRPR